MKDLKNKVTVITGAGSGIGRQLAIQLAERGAKVALADINFQALEETVSLIGNKKAETYLQRLDVSKRDDVYQFADSVIEQYGEVDIIINNAGVSLSGLVNDLTYDNFNWIMDINFWGTVYITKAFLPYLFKRHEANIVNLSSVYGLIGVPAQAAYCASKFAVRGFTEAMRVELFNSQVKVCVVHPGGVKTAIAKNSRSDSGFNDSKTIADFEKTLVTLPEEAAKKIIEGIINDSPRVLIGEDAEQIDLLACHKTDCYDPYIWESIDKNK